MVLGAATHLQVGLSRTETGRGGQAVAVAGENGQDTVTSTFLCIAHVQWCVILTLRLVSSSAPRSANPRTVRQLGMGEIGCYSSKGRWKAKRNTVRLCTNDTMAQQQLPLLLSPLQDGKVAELLLWWVLVWSCCTEEFLE